MICREHYHVATGRDSKNKGKLYKCANTGKDPSFGCCLEPAFEANGEEVDFSKPASVPCKCGRPLFRHLVDTSLNEKPHWIVVYEHRRPNNPVCCLWLSEKEAIKLTEKAKASNLLIVY